MTYLPDVNVWIALAIDIHVHNSIANRWVERLGSAELAFCRITEMGLLRLLTNRHVMDGAPLTASEAWKTRDRILGDPRILIVNEREDFAEHWRRTSLAGRVSPNFWTDAYLISLCASTGCTLVTFDRALARQKRCSVLLLEREYTN